MTRISAWLLVAGWVVSFPPSLLPFLSKDQVGTSSGHFLKLGAGARASAMGGAAVASVYDATSLYWNVAGLALVRRPSVSAMFSSHVDTLDYGYMAYAAPLKSFGGTAGMDVTYVSYGSIARTDVSDADLGSFSPRDLSVSFGYARALGPTRAGASLKYISSKVDRSASTFALNAGAQHRFGKRLQIGIAAENLGPGLKFDKERSPLPAAVRAGAAWAAVSGLLLEADVTLPRDDQPILSAGLDLRVFASEAFSLFVRTGYNSRTLHVQGFAGPAYGFGVFWGSWVVDYAFAPLGDLGQSHRLSLSLKWGNSANHKGSRYAD